MRSGIAATALAAALVGTVTACGTDGQSTDPGAAEGTVTWWDTSDTTTEGPTYQALVAEFEAKYPKIDVEYVNVPFSDAQQKFKTAAQGGNGAPDVLRADVGWIPGFAEQGYLLPLDGTAALDQSDDFLKGPLDTATYDNKSYGAPQVTDTLGLLYNKELFAKANISAPPTTWPEVKTAATALKDNAGVDGIYLNPDAYFLHPFLYGEDAALIDTEDKKITVDSPEAVRAVETARDLVTSGAAAPPAYTDGYSNMQAAFKDGTVGMIINGPWAAQDIYSGKAFTDRANLGVAPVPSGSTGKAGAPVGGHSLVVYAGTEVPTAAQLFVQFMTSTDAQATASQKNGTLPTRQSAYTDAVRSDAVVAGFESIMDTARPRPAIPQYSDLLTPLSQQYIKILQGEPVRSGLAAAARDFGAILPDYTTP